MSQQDDGGITVVAVHEAVRQGGKLTGLPGIEERPDLEAEAVAVDVSITHERAGKAREKQTKQLIKTVQQGHR